MQSLLIVLGIIVVVLVLMYNFLVGRKNQVENIFAGIDTQLKKRYDLIPNVVASVKEYMTHERELLEKVTALRSQAMNAVDGETKVDLNNQLTKMLGSLNIAVENYPDLKANENVMHLQATLNELEEQISAARRAYNQSVTDYNNAIEMFPTNIMARYMGYQRKQVFEIPQIERKNVDVNDLFNR